MIMNKKWIIILICTGVTLLLGSLGITFYAVSRMNRMEELLVFTTETETTVPETTIITNTETTTSSSSSIVTSTTTVVTVEEETEMLVAETYNNNNNNNNGGMTRGQWYEENGYGGYPDEQETFEHDEYWYIKNNNTYMGEFKVMVEYVGYSSMYGGYHVNISEGDAVAGVDTGLNIGDKIYVPGSGYFTIVRLTDTVIFEKDDKIVCFVDADELLYGPDGYLLGYFDTEVYLIE